MLQTLAATSICHSLPLMGIGNAAAAAASERRASFSLPLMGIGNPRRRRQHRPRPPLITPHGDWERADRALAGGRPGQLITPHGDWERPGRWPGRPSAGAHYPSWGLGTAAPALLPCRSPSSLPLMGIGNPECRWARARRPPSLPLMGIGNASDAPHRPHASRSLPLMGIGNPGRRAGVHLAYRLITPHGDWERE